MRSLAQPAGLKKALGDSALSTLAAWPRTAGWRGSPNPTWFLAGVLFWVACCPWVAVFAWHERYCGRPLLVWRIGAQYRYQGKSFGQKSAPNQRDLAWVNGSVW